MSNNHSLFAVFVFVSFVTDPIWVPDFITKIFEFVRISLGKFHRNLHNMSKTATNNKITVYRNEVILVRKIISVRRKLSEKWMLCWKPSETYPGRSRTNKFFYVKIRLFIMANISRLKFCDWPLTKALHIYLWINTMGLLDLQVMYCTVHRGYRQYLKKLPKSVIPCVKSSITATLWYPSAGLSQSPAYLKPGLGQSAAYLKPNRTFVMRPN